MFSFICSCLFMYFELSLYDRMIEVNLHNQSGFYFSSFISLPFSKSQKRSLSLPVYSNLKRPILNLRRPGPRSKDLYLSLSVLLTSFNFFSNLVPCHSLIYVYFIPFSYSCFPISILYYPFNALLR